MTTVEINSQIEKLKKGLDNKLVPEKLKEQMKHKITELEKQKSNLEKAHKETPKKVTEVKKEASKTVSSAKALLEKYKATKEQKEFNKGRSKDDIADDAGKKALKAGKRVSASGNVYYENRPNRSDVSTKRKPYLEDGGEVDLSGDVYKVHYTKKDGDNTVYWEEIYAHSESEAEQKFNDKYVGKGRQIENISNRFAKGGKISNKGAYQNEAEGENYTRYEDSKESNRAKPAGWRYTNAGAKRLKISNPNTYVDKAHLEKYRGKYFTDSKGNKHRYIYIERRADKSDIKRGFPYLERGGKIYGDDFKIKVEPVKLSHNPNYKGLEVKVSKDGVPLKYVLQALVDFEDKELLEAAFANNDVQVFAKMGTKYIPLGFLGKTTYDKYVASLNETFEKGGSIPNNYLGKTPEEVWNEWSVKQKEHFLADHADVIEREDIGKYKSEFKDLSFLAQVQLSLHIEQGQYEKGGELDNIDIAEQYALKVYVKPNKKEGLALYKQGDAICVLYEDDTHDWVGESDILKMEEGDILAEIAEEKLEDVNIDVFGYRTKNFDVSEHAAQYFLEAIESIGENENAKESLAKAAEHLDKILHKVKVKEESNFSEWDVKNIIADVQLFSYNNYKCGLPIAIDLVSNICSEILELDVDVEQVFAFGGEVKNEVMDNDNEHFLSVTTNNEYYPNKQLAYTETIAYLKPQYYSLYKNTRTNDKGEQWIRIGRNAKYYDNGQLAWQLNYNEKGDVIKDDSKSYRKDGTIIEYEQGGEVYAKGGEMETSKPIIEFGNEYFICYTLKREDYKVSPYVVKNREGIIVHKSKSEKDAIDWAKSKTDEPMKKLEELEQGGNVSFSDKVKAIEQKYIGKKVKPKYQKEYGKKYDKTEAHEAATKIAGAMVQKGKMEKGGELLPLTVNKHRIQYSKIYEKWQVKKGKVVLEEFKEKQKAIDWAKEQ